MLKLQIDTTREDESQDVDHDPKVWYAVQENRFCDFAQDQTASQGKFFGTKWTTCVPAMNAYQEAQGKNSKGKKGNWLRNVIKTDLTETQEPADSSSSASAALVPDSFGFKVTGSAKKTSNKASKASKDSGDETALTTMFGKDDDSDDEEGEESEDFASQRFQAEQKSAHIDVVCLC